MKTSPEAIGAFVRLGGRRRLVFGFPALAP
jgi:hypothetical protein